MLGSFESRTQGKNTTMEPLINMDQAAVLLGLTKAQLYELMRTRSRRRQIIPIPFVRLGKRKMFRASSLDEWVSQMEKTFPLPNGLPSAGFH